MFKDGLSTCMKKDSTAYCAVYASYNTCVSCLTNYYKDTKTNRCLSNP